MAEKEQRGRGRPRKYGARMGVFSVRVPKDLYLSVGHFAVDAGASVNEVVNVAVRQYIASNPKPEEFVRPELGGARGERSQKSR